MVLLFAAVSMRGPAIRAHGSNARDGTPNPSAQLLPTIHWMGLVERLAFEYRRRNPVHRGVAGFVSTRFGSWVGKWAVPFLDRLVFRITAGDNTAVGWLAGMPMIWLTTKGRRSGKARRQPLLAFPFEDDLAVIGSNFGRRRHPGWALNLDAHPHAEVEHRDQSVRVTARRAVGDEIERIWESATQRYSGYARYRMAAREIKLFILEHSD